MSTFGTWPGNLLYRCMAPGWMECDGRNIASFGRWPCLVYLVSKLNIEIVMMGIVIIVVGVAMQALYPGGWWQYLSRLIRCRFNMALKRRSCPALHLCVRKWCLPRFVEIVNVDLCVGSNKRVPRFWQVETSGFKQLQSFPTLHLHCHPANWGSTRKLGPSFPTMPPKFGTKRRNHSKQLS